MDIGYTRIVGGFAVMAGGDKLLGVLSSERAAKSAVEIARRYEVVVSEWRRTLPGSGTGYPERTAPDAGTETA